MNRRTNIKCVVSFSDIFIGKNNKSGYCKKHYNQTPNAKENKKRWLDDNIEDHRESNRQWARNNPDKMRSAVHTRRAKLREAFVEVVDLSKVWERDRGFCFICGLPADPQDWWLEHIIPLSRGGTHEYTNVAVSHQTCNQMKSDRLMEEL